MRSRRREVQDPDYVVAAYLRDGRFAAVAATIAVLHARHLVEAGREGTVRRSETVLTAPPDGFERELWSAIHGFVSPGTLMARPPVDAALNDLRRRARRLGLLRRWLPARGFVPARTHRGRQLEDSYLAQCPWPPTPEVTDQPVELRVGLPVALYGNIALEKLMPDFAKHSGLLDRAGTDGLDWADPEAPGPMGRYV
jgi:hypothetical protein